MDTLLTIVVAAYNSEKTLERTLQSLLPLLSRGVRAIIVDDGSCDSTYNIAKDFSRTTKGMEVFKLAHNGSASARNFGLSRVKSKFVMFCDADDEILDFNLEVCQSETAEIIVCDYLFEKANGTTELVKSELSGLASDIFTFSSDLSNDLMNQMGFWRYIYRLEFLRNESIRFVGTLTELKVDYFVLDDYFFLLHVLSSFKIGKYRSVPVYKYFENPQASYLRFQKQSKFISLAALIQTNEMYRSLSRDRRSWYRGELRRQLFSSFHAIPLKEKYTTLWRFATAIWNLRLDSSRENISESLKDTFALMFITLRKTGARVKAVVLSRD
jgi:glycosyltransferase involved in cell wall biosynthesis